MVKGVEGWISTGIIMPQRVCSCGGNGSLEVVAVNCPEAVQLSAPLVFQPLAGLLYYSYTVAVTIINQILSLKRDIDLGKLIRIHFTLMCCVCEWVYVHAEG